MISILTLRKLRLGGSEAYQGPQSMSVAVLGLTPLTVHLRVHVRVRVCCVRHSVMSDSL